MKYYRNQRTREIIDNEVKQIAERENVDIDVARLYHTKRLQYANSLYKKKKFGSLTAYENYVAMNERSKQKYYEKKRLR